MAEPSRPLLLPRNRKIRHLRGIFLRNLTFDRPLRKTADDSAVKHSPAKVESLREASQLHHSASSENLRPGAARRSSTNLGSATPLTRQRHLEASIDKRVAHVFFSLHVQAEHEPVYISETGQRATVRTPHCCAAPHAPRRELTSPSPPELRLPLLRAVPSRRPDRPPVLRTHRQDLGPEVRNMVAPPR